MPQPEPAPSDSGTNEVIPLRPSVEVIGTGNITLTNLRVERDLTITQTIQQTPKPKPTLPAYTPHNLPERTTSAERFVGRSQELEQLQRLLEPEPSRAYLTGMGGVGKSELAIQHAYESFDLYRGGILRLDARQGLDAMALQVVTFFRGAFPDVVLPEDKSPTELLPLCWSQWPSGANPAEPVLLILDDQQGNTGGYAAERKLLEGLPARFRRLITQRETAPARALAIDLPLLQREASLELLALQAGDGNTSRFEEEKQAADALCAEVGDLPLALVLFGAQLAERPDLQLAQLLANLQAKGPAANALSKAHPELGARLGVVEALLISWEPLNEPAKSLALLLAVLAPALIPWELVEACRLPEQEVEEGSAFGDQQAELLRSQFLERSGPGLYQMHPLVRQFIRLQSREVEELVELVGRWRKQFAAAVAGVCRERIPQTLTLEQVKGLETFLPHIREVAEQLAEVQDEADLAWPCDGLARVAEHQAAFAEALKWYQRGLEQCEQRLGAEHPSTATALNNLAMLLLATNRLAEAKPLMERALAIAEASYGPVHPEVALYHNNLATLLKDLGRLGEAEALMRRVVEISEISYGPDDPIMASALSNLGHLLMDTNRLEEAESLMVRALKIVEARPDHPEEVTVLTNLASVLQATKRLEEAEPLMWRVLEINEARYGPHHPNVARSLNNLALLLQESSRLAEAEPLMRRALVISEASYGPAHPSVAIRLNNLAVLLKDTGRLAEAKPLMVRALAIDEASYGSNHPSVAIRLNNLAGVLLATNLLAEAEPLMERALAIDEASYGPHHPNVAKDLNNLAQLLHETDRLAEAERLMSRVVEIMKITYGPDHPELVTPLNNLAALLDRIGRPADAELLVRRALIISEANYGRDHPEVAKCLGILTALLQRGGRLVEAELLMKRVVEIYENSYGPDDLNLASAVNTLAGLLHATNRLEEAELLMGRAFTILWRNLGLDHPNTQGVVGNYISILQAMGLPEAEIEDKLLALLPS